MNLKIVFYYLGWVLNIEAVLMLLPCAVSLVYGDGMLPYFLVTMVICTVIGFMTAHKKPADTVFYAREGFLTVALTWVMLSFFGALPFWFSRQIPSLVDAMFETISGFTTTGASILSDVEALSPSLLMWRSFTHWVGGMGVLVFVLRRLQHVPDACGKPRSIGWKINAEGQEYGENPVSDLFGYDGIADDPASDRRDAIV